MDFPQIGEDRTDYVPAISEATKAFRAPFPRLNRRLVAEGPSTAEWVTVRRPDIEVPIIDRSGRLWPALGRLGTQLKELLPVNRFGQVSTSGRLDLMRFVRRAGCLAAPLSAVGEESVQLTRRIV